MTNVLTEEQRQAIFQRIPMQKLGTVDDVAAAVLFLASQCSRLYNWSNFTRQWRNVYELKRIRSCKFVVFE